MNNDAVMFFFRADQVGVYWVYNRGVCTCGCKFEVSDADNSITQFAKEVRAHSAKQTMAKYIRCHDNRWLPGYLEAFSNFIHSHFPEYESILGKMLVLL